MNDLNIDSSKTKQAIIKYLTDLGTGKKQPEDPSLGMCANLHCAFYPLEVERLTYKAALSWKFYSGDCCFPIPESPYNLDRYCAYRVYHNNYNKWDNSEYANLRREFCLHMAAHLKSLRLSYGSKK